MANVKYSGAVSDIRGSIGGQQFGRNKTGAVIGNTKKRVNTPSVDRGKIKNSFSAIARNWRGLSASERGTWSTQAVNYPIQNKFGDFYTPSGFQLYMKLNNSLIQTGSSGLVSAPPPVSFQALQVDLITLDPGSGNFNLSLVDPTPVGVKLLVFASSQKSPGLNFRFDEFRLMGSFAPAAVISIADEFEAAFGVPVSGLSEFNRVWVQVFTINEDTGVRSPGSLYTVAPAVVPVNTWAGFNAPHAYVLGTNGGTTPQFDTSISNILVVQVCSYGPSAAPVLSDNQGNTFVLFLTKIDTLSTVRIQLYYCIGNVFSTNHSFTLTGAGQYSTICIWSAYSTGTPTPGAPFSTDENLSNSATLPSVSPSAANVLWFSGVNVLNTNNPFAVDSGFTKDYQQNYVAGVNLASAGGHKMVTVSAPESPTWSWPNGIYNVSYLAYFIA